MKIELLKNIKIGVWEILLAGLLTFHFVANLFWILINNAPTLWDPSNHAYIAILISDRIKNFDPIGILYASNYYPIFIHFLTSIPLTILGHGMKLAQFTGTVYFLITLCIIYLYIKQTTKNLAIAFLTVFIFSFLPVVYDQSRFLMLDIPSVGILFLCLYFLDKSDFLINRKYALLTAFSAGFLAMTKWTPLLFLVVPFLLILILFFKSNKKIQILINALLGGGVFLVTVFPWYFANWNDILFLTQVYGEGDPKAHPQVMFSIENLVTYYKIFLYTQAAPFIALVFFVCLFIYPFLKIPKTSILNSKWFVLLMILINYLFFTAILNKDGRFTIHLLVFACLIISYVFLNLVSRWRKSGLVVLGIFMTLVFSYYLLLTVRPSNLEGAKFSVNVPILGGLEFINVDDSLVKKYDTRNWEFEKLIPDLKNINDGSEIKILVISEWAHFNPSNIRTFTKIEGLGNIIPVTPDLPYLRKTYGNNHFPNDEELKNFISRNHYLLASSSNIGSPYLLNMIAMKQVQSFAFPENFPSCNKFRIEVSKPETKCFIKAGETLSTGSDILVDEKPAEIGEKIITGFAEVSCPFGCSFEFTQKTEGEDIPGPILEIIKTYILPNGQEIYLFKVNPQQTTSNLIN